MQKYVYIHKFIHTYIYVWFGFEGFIYHSNHKVKYKFGHIQEIKLKLLKRLASRVFLSSKNNDINWYQKIWMEFMNKAKNTWKQLCIIWEIIVNGRENVEND